MSEDNRDTFRYLYSKFAVYSGMVFFAEDLKHPKSVINNGTMSFIDTGKEKIMVTCAHVYHEYKQKKKDSSELYLGLAGRSGTQPLNISNAEIIDIGRPKDIDLVTMHLPKHLNLSSIGSNYYKSLSWPPKRVKKDDVTFFIGYPENPRKPSHRGLETPAIVFVGTVSSVSFKQFILAKEDDERIQVKFIKSLNDLKSMSGISGAVLFKSLERRNFSLAGIVYEADSSFNATFFCHHMDLINIDGSIKHNII